jgi:hypothetical protein
MSVRGGGTPPQPHRSATRALRYSSAVGRGEAGRPWWATLRWVLAALVATTTMGACRGLAGLHDLAFAPDAGCEPPALPAVGGGHVRLVNAAPGDRGSDFCVRPAGSSDWGRPVFSAGGTGCASGLAYAQSTVPFAVPVGAIDVEAVPEGAACTAAATSTLLGVAVGDASSGAAVVTLVRIGSGAHPEQIVALPEEPAPDTVEQLAERLRVVDALASGEALNLGFGGASLPTTIAIPLLAAPIAQGGVPASAPNAPSLGSIDAAGYIHTQPLGLNVGVVFEGQTRAEFVVNTPIKPDTETVYAIGSSRDPAHPVRGLLCEDGSGAADAGAPGAGGGTVLADCQLTALPSLVVDTFNVGLYGASSPFENDRRPAILAAIAARTSDLMCLVETSRDADKAAIVQAAHANLPYAFVPRTDLSTPPDDPTTAEGLTPPPPSQPPCGGVDPSKVQGAYDCMTKGCSSTHDLTGTIATASCLTEACAGPISQLYEQGPAENACFDCIAYYAVSTLPLSVGHTECTQDVAQPFAFLGMTSSMILSRFPLGKTRAYVLAGSGFRHAVLAAEVDLEDQAIDFYCVQLISPLIDGSLPYVGNYGQDGTRTLPDGGQAPENGWEDEQDLQVKRAIAFIQSNSAATGRPAIVAGDWHASVRATSSSADGGSQVVLVDQSPEVIAAVDQSLGGAFVRAAPAGWIPSCNYCPAPTNAFNGSGVNPVDFTRTFLLGFPDGSAVDDSFWGTDNGAVTLTPVPYETMPPGGKGPLSEFYPRAVRILRPPVH